MSTNYNPTNIHGGVSTETSINQNFADIQTALGRTLNVYGDSATGSNAMHVDLDMNGKNILNVTLVDGLDLSVSSAQASANANASAVAAAASQSAAAASQAAAASSASSASTSASTALTQANNASASASAASTSAFNANASASSASSSASTATTQAGNAGTSASSASTSASTATTQAGIATTQAGIATTQASNASTSASSASSSASTATTQAGIATTQANNASASAAAAAASAAGVTLPSAVANTFLQQNGSTTGYITQTAAQVKATLNTNIGALVRVSSYSAITFASAVHTSIPFDTESYDTNNIHDNVTNNTRLTVPSGVSMVRLSGNVSIQHNATGYRELKIIKNGATGSLVMPSSSAPGDCDVSYGTRLNVTSPILQVTPGDYFTLVVFQNSGSTLDCNVSDPCVWFSMEIIA